MEAQKLDFASSQLVDKGNRSEKVDGCELYVGQSHDQLVRILVMSKFQQLNHLDNGLNGIVAMSFQFFSYQYQQLEHPRFCCTPSLILCLTAK